MDFISEHDKEAAEYDRQVQEYNCYLHDALFGMAYEYVKSHETLLDIGIGTGLASLPFAKAGLEVHGLDGSVEMLKVCESKAFAKDLKRFDLRTVSLPYSDHSFDHVICCGVFHFFGDLAPTVKEVSRIVKPGGVFAFTVAAQTPEEAKAADNRHRDFLEKPTAWDVDIYVHSDRYVERLLKEEGFEISKAQKLLLWSGSEEAGDMLFKVVVARMTG
jgi:predicted TPR repeat methyltransferase